MIVRDIHFELSWKDECCIILLRNEVLLQHQQTATECDVILTQPGNSTNGGKQFTFECHKCHVLTVNVICFSDFPARQTAWVDKFVTVEWLSVCQWQMRTAAATLPGNLFKTPKTFWRNNSVWFQLLAHPKRDDLRMASSCCICAADAWINLA